MATPVGPAQASRIYSKETVLVARLRRDLLKHLDQLDQTLLQYGEQDSLTGLIFSWKANFKEAVCSNTFDQGIRGKFFTQIKELLVDALPCQTAGGSVFFPPLDEDALLGSDGFVYGKRWFSILFSKIPQEMRERSPLRPESADPFSLQPHLPARFLVQWLKEEGQMSTMPEIDALYSQLKDQIPLLPGLPQLNQRLQTRIARFKLREAAIEQQSREKAKEEVDAYVKSRFDVVRQEIHDQQTSIEQQINLDNIELEHKIKEIKERIAQSEVRTAELLLEIKRNHELLDSSDSELTRLEVATQELQKEIEAKKQDGFTAVLCVLGSIVVTYALNQFTFGAQVMLQPTSCEAGLLILV